ncbi:MAG: mechanosensitive ion channel domain-containing protein [Aliihoeflea sp.]
MRLLAVLFAAIMSLSVPAAAQETTAPAPVESGQPATQGNLDELIRLLEDDATRRELLELLRQRAEGTDGTLSPAEAEEQAAAAEGVIDPTIARQIAEYTRSVAEGLAATVTSIVDVLSDVGELFSSAAEADFARLAAMLTNLSILLVTLFTSFFLLRLAAARIQSAIAARLAGTAWINRAGGVLAAGAADMAAVLLAWTIGYFVAINFLSDTFGRMQINQTLLLNAFLVVETIKVVMRAVFEHRDPELRFVPMSDTTAAYWYFWSARLVSLIGYTFMLLAPILAEQLSPGAAQALRVLIMKAAVIIGILIILQNKNQVRDALSARARAGREDVLSRTLAVVGRYWHMVAIFYLLALLAVWLTNPAEALPFMLRATGQSLLAILVGSFVIGFISRMINVGVRLPDDIKERLPLLEARLQAFVPRVMQIVRTIVLFGVIIAIAQAWSLIDFFGWVATEGGQRTTGALISAVFIVLAGFVIYLAMSSWVEYRLNPNYGSVPTAREKTLLALFRNAFTITLAVMVAMLALAQIGVNIAPLLAGAGVLGLAIGFGAQKFVQDIITGIFIQFENIMNEGDVVEVAGRAGVVEKLTIRSVSIRSLDGTVHLIPFSSVDSVSNMMKGFSFHVAEIGVAYREDIGEVKAAMLEAYDLLMETDHKFHILEPLDIQGVTSFGDSAVMVRARIKTRPGMQWGTGRAYNELIKQVFDRHGIEIPFPHVTLYMGEDKQGRSPALNLRRSPVIEEQAIEEAPAEKEEFDTASVAEPVNEAREMEGRSSG